MMSGKVVNEKMRSAFLENNPLGDSAERDLLVYVPPGYEGESTRYPVVYFLHGFMGSARQWLNVSTFTRNVPERLDQLISTGAIPKCIGVFIDGFSALGGSQWINSDGVGRYREYVAKDVVNFVDKNFRTIAKGNARALIGKSSGGYGAMVITRFHPDVFSHLGVHSGDSGFEYSMLHEFPTAAGPLLKAGGVEAWYKEFLIRAMNTKMRSDDHPVINLLCMAACYSPKKGEPLNLELPIELETGRLKIDVWNRWLVHDPVRFVPKHLDVYKKLKSIFLDCGTKDEFHLRWGTRIIAEEFKKGGVEHVHEEFEDGHMGVNYRFENSLKYLVKRMEQQS
jgi:pimeloyl-ACP methyl ester carboxylesterase